MQTGAVIVAAGLSSRMKSFKPLLQLAGSTVIKTAIATLKEVGVSKIVVVVGKNASQLVKHLADMDVECIYNERYMETDMFYSACMGMSHIAGLCDRFFFLPADVPLFSSQSLFTMMGYMDFEQSDIVTPFHNGRPGHPLLLAAKAVAELTAYQGPGGLRGAVQAYSAKTSSLDLPDIGITLDADKPEDYQLLTQYAKSVAIGGKLDCSFTVTLHKKALVMNETLAKILELVEESSSLSKACVQMNIAYSNAWKMVKIAENQLGFPLLASMVGGHGGGGSSLTEQGKAFLDLYRQFREDVNQYGEVQFHKLFHEYQQKD